MARKVSPIGDLATAVLAEVDREQVVKTAAMAHTSHINVQTHVGALLLKTAALVREEAEKDSIDYDDLIRFRKTYGI